MNDIIKINQNDINGNLVNTVNARELHEFLGVKRRFADWIKDNLEIFTQDVDFIVFHKNEKNSDGRPRIEYALTIECGKHIAMQSRTEKGRKIRDYFIECERKSQNPIDVMKALNDPASLRNLLGNYAEKVIALENKLEEQQPKVEALERIAVADGGLNLTNTAKSLNVRPKDLFQFLQLKHWIYRRAGSSNLVGYQDKIQSGYLTHKVYTVKLSDGTERIVEQVIVTPKGLTKLASIVPATALSAGAECRLA